MPKSGHRDIVIVGGGIIGVCSAYYILLALKSSGQAQSTRVTLIEEEAIACGASGKAGGFLALDWHGPATASLAKLSYALYKQLNSEHDGASRWDYRDMASLTLSVSANGGTSPPEENAVFEESHVHMTKPNGDGSVEVDWLEPSGTTNALGTTETTGQVHPKLFTEGIFSAALQKGLTFIRGRPTNLNYSPSSSALESVEIAVRPSCGTAEQQETIPCTDLILTAGPWTAQVASTLNITPFPPIINLPGHSVLIRPARPAPLSATAVFASIYGANPQDTTDSTRMTGSPELFPRPDGLVFVGGENVARGMPQRAGEVDALMDAGIADRLVRAAGVVAPELGRGTVVARQLCYRPITPDRRPVVGKVKDHIWVASGHGPWGITLGPGTGKVIAELVLHGIAQSADIAMLDPTRFSQ